MSFRGFDINLNLIENVDDRDALNNLGGAPIADDIALFLNNLRNSSSLNVTSTERQGSYIRFDENTQKFVFTNGTRISVGSTLYFVGDSNATNEFRLYSDEGLNNLVSNPPLGLYRRSDAVSFDDITNLVRPREPVVENLSLGQIGDLRQDPQRRSNIYTSYIRVYNELRPGFGTDLSGFINSIDNELDVFDLRRTNSVNNLFNFNSDNRLSLSGNILISDPDGINTNTVSANSGPGIFILNSDTNQSTRIFSSNENIWTEDGNDLVAASREILVGNFVFDSSAKILRKNEEPLITPEESSVTSFTHFVDVIINDEPYSLCLVQKLSVFAGGSWADGSIWNDGVSV
jgi:hypothetical protein